MSAERISRTEEDWVRFLICQGVLTSGWRGLLLPFRFAEGAVEEGGGLLDRGGEIVPWAWAREPSAGGGRWVGDGKRRVLRNSTLLRTATVSEHHADRTWARQAAALQQPAQ